MSTIATSTPRAVAAFTVSKATAAGVAPVGPRDHLAPRPLAPGLELLASGCAERIARAEQHAAPGRPVTRRELSDGRRLSGTVHPEHEDHVGLRFERQRFADGFDLCQLACDRFAQGRPHRVAIAAVRLASHVLQQVVRRPHTEVRREEQRLDLLQGIRVQGPPAEHGREPADERIARPTKTVPQPDRLGRRDGLGCGHGHRLERAFGVRARVPVWGSAGSGSVCGRAVGSGSAAGARSPARGATGSSTAGVSGLWLQRGNRFGVRLCRSGVRSPSWTRVGREQEEDERHADSGERGEDDELRGIHGARRIATADRRGGPWDAEREGREHGVGAATTRNRRGARGHPRRFEKPRRLDVA